MSMIDAIPLLAGAGADGGYQISRSVRTRSSASAYFNRTFSTPTLSTKWTWGGWAKRGTLGAAQTLFSGQVDVNNWGIIAFLAGDTLSFQQADAGSVTSTVTTTQVFRDPSAWYHIVVVFDSTQATAANRLKMYVNGVQVTAFGTATYLAQNTASRINAAVAHQISRYISAAQYFDGYMTEVNFVDGQALTPSSFGETNALTGVWQPKKYAGTYGTNGFYLNFSDNSGVTATTIGKDYSGNGNNWTPNNISITAGVTYDSMLDVPTPYADGGNGRGNYAVLNPLALGTSQTSLTEGNLYAIPITGASNWGTVFSSIAIPTSGKWYMEAVATVFGGSGNNSSLGVVDGSTFIPTNTAVLWQYTTGEGFDGILCHLFSDYVAPIADGVQGTNITGITGTSVNLMLALDVDNGKVYAGYNGTWLNSGNPAGNTGEVATRVFSANDVVAGNVSWNSPNNQSQYFNFGQRPFTYTPPTGFKALNTQNLPTPTISKGNQYMDVVLYTGNAVQDRAITGFGFDLDLAWIKSRNNAGSHVLVNNVVGGDKQLFSNLTNAEQTNSDMTNGFTTGGILVGDNITGTGSTNQNTYTYALWGWNAGGSTVTNTSGTISSQVRANATAGFSVVTWTSTGANATIGHGLGVAPKMVIVKGRSAVSQWFTWHTGLTSGAYALILNLTDAQASYPTVFNSTTPTSSVFSVGTSLTASTTAVAYCFAEVAGYSAFGKYTGNGSADGPFVFLGFRPRFVMVKRTDSTSDWYMYDTSRSTYNAGTQTLAADLSLAESSFSSTNYFDILSNGFKLRQDNASGYANASGGTYIYACFAENPFKNSLAR